MYDYLRHSSRLPVQRVALAVLKTHCGILEFKWFHVASGVLSPQDGCGSPSIQVAYLLVWLAELAGIARLAVLAKSPWLPVYCY